MAWSFTLARIAGTSVRIHLTFILFLAWIGITFWLSGSPTDAVVGVLYIITVFLCVLAHEFGHAIAALRYGITTPSITLYPIGGIARLTRIPKDPKQELIVAMAGPLVNFLIAALLTLIGGGLPTRELSFPPVGGEQFLGTLLWINLFLAVFNLIPAFPMDGGRILRALLGFFTTRERATTIAAATGQSLALCGGILALFTGQPILLLISIFVFFAAKSEASLVNTEHLLTGMTARDAALSEFHTVQMDDSLETVIDHVLHSSQVDFPVINSHGQCVSIATQAELFKALRERGSEARVSDLVENIPAQIHGDTPLLEAWEKLRSSRLPAAAVTDETGRLAAWLTLGNLSEVIMTRSALEEFAWRQRNDHATS